jgi:hypothetical protein
MAFIIIENAVTALMKAHLQRMQHARIPIQAHKYQPSGKRDISRPRRRWRETQQY